MGGLYAKLFRKKDIRIIIQGLDAAGKTTMLYRLKLGEVVTTIPTIGFNVETLEHKNINITAWDVGGRDKMRPLWRHYYKNTQALVYVVDSNDHERMEEVRDEFHRTVMEDELKDCVLLVIANKQDLPNAYSVAKIVEELGLHQLRCRDWNIFPCVATSGDGLYEAMDWLAEACQKRNITTTNNKPVVKKPAKTKDQTADPAPVSKYFWSSDNLMKTTMEHFKRIFLVQS